MLAGLDGSPAWQVARVVVVIAAIALAVWFTRRAGRPAGATALLPAASRPGGPPPARRPPGCEAAMIRLPLIYSRRSATACPNAELRSRVPSGCAVRIAAADSLLTSSPSGPLAHAFSTPARDFGAARRHDPERAARTSSGKPQPGGRSALHLHHWPAGAQNIPICTRRDGGTEGRETAHRRFSNVLCVTSGDDGEAGGSAFAWPVGGQADAGRGES